MIQGKCEVNGRTLTVLYDSKATPSFISHDCVDRLGLPMSELPYVLIVSTPAGKPVKTCQCCVNCCFEIDGRSFVANLICLPLSGLDLILGMDWLLANRAMINCSEKSIVLPPIPMKTVEPICLFLNSIRIGSSESDNQGYVLLMASDVELEQVLDEILVVREYPDVFPDDIPEFPIEREIKFSIKLVSAMGQSL